MAKTYQQRILGDITQADFDGIAHSLLFADKIECGFHQGDGTLDVTYNYLQVTSNVESVWTGGNATHYEVLADDSQSEVSVDIATGKFVEGNIICGVAPLSEIQSDVRDFVTYNNAGSDKKWFIGVCATTQSQDYTPDIIANSRVIKMMTPAQVKSLNL